MRHIQLNARMPVCSLVFATLATFLAWATTLALAYLPPLQDAIGTDQPVAVIACKYKGTEEPLISAVVPRQSRPMV